MSGLKGCFYFDAAPISDRDRAWLESGDPGASTFLSPAPNVCFAQSAELTLSNRGNLCVWEGDLHNQTAGRRSADLSGPGNHRNSEIALGAYEVGGPGGLADLIGDWSLAIWDQREHTLLLASDYAGVRPLFYYQDARKLLWSSSLEELRQAAGAEPLDESYASAFITSGSGKSWTPYRGIQLVPCGAALIADRSRSYEFQFWKPPEDELRLADDAEYEERFRELFREAVATRLASTRPVCAELSGGLDSSSIVCMAARLISAGAVKAPELVAFSYLHPNSIDRPFMEIVQEASGVRTVQLEIAQFPPIVAECSWSAPLWWEPRLEEVRARMAALDSKVLLTGQLGDLVAGNWVDDSEQVADYLASGRLAEAVREAFSWSRALRVPIWGILRRAIGSVVRPGSSDFFAGLVNGEDSLTPRFRRIAASLGKPASTWHQCASASRRKRLVTLQSMIDARVLQCPAPLQDVSYSHPFLHRPLVEFMLSAPSAVVCRPNEPRRLMRRALRGIVPDAVLRRRSKASYGGEFIRALQVLAALLIPEVERMRLVQDGIVKPDSIRTRLRRLLEGLECNEPQLRRLILLEFWLRNRLTRPLLPLTV